VISVARCTGASAAIIRSQGANSRNSRLGKPGKGIGLEALIYANFKPPSIEYIVMSALRLDLSLAQQKAGILLVTFHKRILEWQADHPNITWVGWGIVWAIVLVLLFWPRPSE